MSYLYKITLLWLLLLLVGGEGTVLAQSFQIRGAVDLQAAGFESTRNRGADVSADHFVQKYAVSMSQADYIRNGSLGRYSLRTDYEWAVLDGDAFGREVSADRDSLGWDADLQIAPGGLPFSLTLFSRRSFGVPTSGNLNYFDVLNKFAVIPVQGIVTSLGHDGQQLSSGFTLVVGEENSDYDSRFGHIMGSSPALFVDYRDHLIKSESPSNPQHSRLKYLAFVSLNKRDNWLHMRRVEFEDYLSPANDFEERTYQLGTVNYAGRREWINLTNWIQLSVDGTVSTRETVGGKGDNNRYSVNLFTVFNGRKAHAAQLATFERKVYNHSSKLIKKVELPVFSRGNWGKNHSWNLTASYNARTEDDLSTGAEVFYSDYPYLEARLDLYRHGKYAVKPRLIAESLRSSFGDADNLQLTYETYERITGNGTWQPHLKLVYSNFRGSDPVEGDGSVNEYEMSLQLKRRAEKGVSYALSQYFLYAQGDFLTIDPVRVQSASRFGVGGEETGFRDSDTVWRSSTGASVTFSTGQLQNRVGLNYSVKEYSQGKSDQAVGVDHSLRYSNRKVKATMSTAALFGDYTSATGNDRAQNRVSNNINAAYMPSRNWELRYRQSLYRQEREVYTVYDADIRQSLRFTTYTASGVIRPLVLVEEIFRYKVSDVSSGGTTPPSTTELTVLSSYMPTRYAQYKLGLGYCLLNQDAGDDGGVVVSLGAAWTFSRLRVALDYAYGYADDEVADLKVREQKWGASVRKNF